MKYVFIDSNIWLSLYHFTDADLAEFEKLKKYINNGSLKIICTSQVYEEIQRNRENKLQDSLKAFCLKEPNYPVFVKGYASYDEIRNKIKEVQNSLNQLNNQINDDLLNVNLPADRTINELLNLIGITSSDEYIDSAYRRFLKGNPPGKNNSYGDAINWEALLYNVPINTPLYLISNDKDYQSALDKNRINSYLLNEWRFKKQADIYFYNNLVGFLKDHAKDIVLSEAQEKKELIDALKNSNSYSNTHAIIAALNKFNEWTIEEIEDLCQSLLDNSQVRDIRFDPDVSYFYTQLLGDDDSQFMGVNSIQKVIGLYNISI